MVLFVFKTKPKNATGDKIRNSILLHNFITLIIFPTDMGKCSLHLDKLVKMIHNLTAQNASWSVHSNTREDAE